MNRNRLIEARKAHVKGQATQLNISLHAIIGELVIRRKFEKKDLLQRTESSFRKAKENG